MTDDSLAILLRKFFTGHLMVAFGASSHTILSYRDSFKLLLNYTASQRKCETVDLRFEDLDADRVGGFLTHLEVERNCGCGSRNTRLAAIRSFFRFAATQEPQHLHQCQQILAIPNRRCDRPMVSYLSEEETEALIAAPDTTTWTGRRDRCLLMVARQTGLRVSELIALTHRDITFGSRACVRCTGKGRKERATPLRSDSIKLLKAWLAECPGHDETAPVFVTRRGRALSRDAVERIVKRHVITATRTCPSLGDKRITPHSLRHSCAMELLRSEIDCTVIALWLGHESVESTQVYLHADPGLKEAAMERTRPANVPAGRFRPSSGLMAFLDSLG